MDDDLEILEDKEDGLIQAIDELDLD